MDLARTAEFLAEVAVKGAVIVGVAFVAAACLRRRSAAARSWVWTMTFMALAMLPALTAALPYGRRVPVPPEIRAAFLPRTPQRPRAPSRWQVNPARLVPMDPTVAAIRAGWDKKKETRQNLQTTAALLWALGALPMLLRVGTARLRAARLVRRAVPADPALWGQHPGYDVRSTSGIATPITTGIFRPVVLVPGELTAEDTSTTNDPVAWPAEGRRAAVQHELAHVDRRDAALQCLADLVCAVNWCNPLVWLAARRLRLDREIAADDAVLAGGTRSSDYASFLVDLAARPSSLRVPGAIVPILTRAGLKARLLAILDEGLRRAPPSRRLVAVGAFACGCLASIVATTGSSTTQAAARVSAGMNPPPEIRLALEKLPSNRRRFPGANASGVLRGRVIDKATGRPASGAQVDLMSNTSEPIDWTIADADGRFRFAALLRDHQGDIYGIYARKGPLAARQTARVPVGEEKDLVIELAEKGHAITGLVLDDHGQPLAGPSVGIDGATNSRLGPGDSATALTDADGRYRIEGVLPMSGVNVRATAEGFATNAQRFSLADNDVGADFQLVHERHVEGVVVTAAGQPLAGAIVAYASRSRGTILGAGQAVTEADGSFWFRATGEAAVLAYHHARRLVMPAIGRVFVDAAQKVRLVVEPGAYVSGTVRGADGRPAAGVTVWAVWVEVFAEEGGLRHLFRAAPEVVQTAEDGSYQVGPLASGRYGFTFQSGTSPAPTPRADMVLRVESQRDVVGADYTLPKPQQTAP